MTNLVRTTDDEAGALVRLGFEELRGFTESIGTMERDIAARAFRYVPAGRPIQFVHDTIARGVIGALGGAASVAGRGAHVARRPPPAPGAPAVGDAARRPRARGPQRPRRRPPRARRQPARRSRWRCGSTACRSRRERAALAEAFPAATPRLVVFLHGLMESERGWRLGARAGREDYGTPARARPRRHARLRPLQQRPPHLRERALAGRAARAPSSPSGRSRSRRSRSSATRWAGSSRAARATCAALEDDRRGSRSVRKVVSLGSPHMGAPLEQAVHYAAFGLSRLPETRMLGAFLRRRSAGIRDLRQGSLVDEDWRERDPEALRAVACAGGAAARGRDALLRLRDRHPQPAPPARPDASATRSCSCPARRASRARASSASRPSTGCTSARPTTSRCSTTPRCTRSFRRGCARPTSRTSSTSRRAGRTTTSTGTSTTSSTTRTSTP